MKISYVALFILLAVNLLTDGYIYFRLKQATQKHKWLKKAHIAFSAILCISLVAIAAAPFRTASTVGMQWIMWTLFTYISTYLPKYLYAISAIIANIPRLFKRKRWNFVSTAGAIIGFLLFGTMWWGALVTPRQVNIEKVDIRSERLPKNFDGFTIALFSDLHTGTFGNNTGIVENLVEEINRQNADMVIFAGDIVNRSTSELYPFIPALKQIKARYGVVSVLGNHDYGDYMKWDSEEDYAANIEKLVTLQNDSLGWRLLRDQSFDIYAGPDKQKIAIIGVDNWGEPPFKTYGNLQLAYDNLNDSVFKILVSHNPRHWDLEVVKKTNIDLTLSGHTHAMQSMLEIGGKKYSLAAKKYPNWAGLTSENGKYLYVNIGIGEVGVPMRLGATPELTLITLHCN